MHDLYYPGGGSVLLMFIELHFHTGDTWIENCILPAGILECKLYLGVKDKRMNKVGVCFLESHHVGTRVGAVSKSSKPTILCIKCCGNTNL